MLLCTTCERRYCLGCKEYHSDKHGTRQLSVRRMIWHSTMADLRALKDCSLCAGRVRCRIECPDCHLVICYECSQIVKVRKKWHKDHEVRHSLHQRIIEIVSPTFLVPSVVSRNCHCVEDEDSLFHCNGCLQSMVYNSSMDIAPADASRF
jgi:hypothetical protein